MKREKIITLDLTGCKNWYELHERIRIVFDFPDGYGHNWIAFSDFLWSECDADKVVIIGETKVANNLKADIKSMNELLEKNKQYWANSDTPFDYEIIS